MSYLIYLAEKKGLLGFTAEVLVENKPMLHALRLFEQMGFEIEWRMESRVYELGITFNVSRAHARMSRMAGSSGRQERPMLPTEDSC